MKAGALRITRTAIFIALLTGLQFMTAPLGQLVTGPVINLVLIVSVMTCGLSTGLTVGLLSPVFAKIIGIGPLWPLVPFIMAGNSTLIAVWHFMGGMRFANARTVRLATLITAAAAKFMVLYIGIVRIAVPYALNLPERQAQVITGTFSIAQFITALLGGAMAALALPAINKARTAINL
jgi:hypothetical protein